LRQFQIGIAAKEDERRCGSRELLRDAETPLAMKIDVEDCYVHSLRYKQIHGVADPTDRAEDVEASRLQRQFDLVGD
jgi:hypothetical protein